MIKTILLCLLLTSCQIEEDIFDIQEELPTLEVVSITVEICYDEWDCFEELSIDEVSELYNSGAGMKYPFK